MYNVKITNCVWLLLFVITLGYSQSKKRTKKEVFTVNKDVILEINTSHADVEFDTWNKNKIEIEAIIEIEDATDAEVEEYVKKWNFEAIGNSKKVTVTSKGKQSIFGDNIPFSLATVPKGVDVPKVLNIPDLPEGVTESMTKIVFDYQRFKDEGEAYMKEWQQQFQQNFDEKKFKEAMEKWQQQFQKNFDQEKFEKEMQKWQKHYEKYMQEYSKLSNDAYKNLNFADDEVLKKYVETIKQLDLARVENGTSEKDMIFKIIESDAFEELLKMNGEINDKVFKQFQDYKAFPVNGKRFKIKKTIKIKMPKKAKLQLNVRHGEVTIAAVSENIHAKLSHASLYATVIEGADTTIESSYAPVHITTWNQGTLKVNFADTVDLLHVNEINLMANSSSVSVGRLGAKGIISGTIGKLLIHQIDENFQTLDIILENTDTRIQLPDAAFKLYYIGSNSSISYPETVIGTKNDTQFNTIVRGFQGNNTTNKEININAKYSEVDLNGKS